MKKILSFLCVLALIFCLHGCKNQTEQGKIVATTKPVYDFTKILCADTDIIVELLITENVSCLHDYTLQVYQMRSIESAETVIISGAGLEDFLHDVLEHTTYIIDASEGIDLHCSEHAHSQDDSHHHESDPHIWLSIPNARQMASNIHKNLCTQYPESKDTFDRNLEKLNEHFQQLQDYGEMQLTQLSCRNLITFHDGFSYFAEDWDLHILHSVEEESGSEASAAELKELIQLVQQHDLPAVFTEENGSTSAAQIVSTETGIQIFVLNMAMSHKDYFTSMRQNIDAVKEALE